MQSGTLSQRGRFWYLRFYESVLVGSEVVRRQKAVKLAPVAEYPTEKDVRAARLHVPVLTPINAKTATAESTMPLAEFIEFVYLPSIRETKKPSTHAGYMDTFKVLKPHLNGLELRKVRTSHIEQILESVASVKPRANSTMKHYKAFFSGAFRYAVRKDLRAENPVRPAVAPKGLKSQPEDTYAYSLEEVQAMLAVLKEPARTIVLVAALSGLRMGEIAGLKWSDIGEDQISVGRAMWHGDVVETKTEGSRAPIPLIPIVKRALAKHRRRSRGEFVFVGNRDGKPVVMDNVKRRAIIPALTKKGIASLWHGWHAFRRGVGTNLKELGVDDLTISRILRHDGVAVTQAHYIKRVEKPSADAMAKLERAFLAAK